MGFYADFDGNGMYNPPPTDHAWRLSLETVQGYETLTFSHNTMFTDIEWLLPLAIGGETTEVIPNSFHLF